MSWPTWRISHRAGRRHDPQDVARPGGGAILSNDEEFARKLNAAVFPGMPGGPLMHVIVAKAVAFGEAPSFRLYAKSVFECEIGAGFFLLPGPAAC